MTTCDQQLMFSSSILRHGTWLGYQDEFPLPHPPGHYRMRPLSPDRVEVSDLDGNVVYRGIGPVEIIPA